MSSTTKRLNVAELDFEDIKNNLKEFLRGQDEFRDYDFEGSAMGTLIDILAYTTHYNAVNANIGINETFLDTAQFRGSVVGHARQLGYTPRSASAPVGVVDIVVNNPNSQNLTLPKGFRFKSKIGNTSYNFVTEKEVATRDATFSGVKIVEGTLKTVEYFYDVRGDEKILIPDADVDTSTVAVEVFDSENSGTSKTFSEAKQITSITSESTVYFINENPDGLFEISFGDGVLGTALENGNLVRVDYLTTNKVEANGARIFTTTESIDGNSDLTITTVQPARGGGERESIDSIQYNAPLTFASQNRAVVPNDYDAVIRENFANAGSIKVWGGEDNDPPVYGQVFVSILPKTGDALTIDEKNLIQNEILEPKSVVTVTPVILDPEFLIITLEVFFKYDPSLTNLSERQLENKVLNVINDFDDNTLGQFDNVFRYSQFLQTIDESDPAILNSFARVYLSKRFVPTLNVPTSYTLNFSVPLYESFGARPVIFESSTFTVNGISGCRFKDFLNDDGSRRVSIVKGAGEGETVIVRNAGVIEEERVILESFAPDSIDGEVINIEVVPSSYDIIGTLNTVITLDCACDRFNIQGEIDTIATGRDFSGTNYQTFNRDG